MSVEIIGGQRLGSGGKMKTDQPHYNRSTHDLSYIWKNTQAPDTLVPFMVEIGLPGSTFDIDLDNNALTHPTNGPLFGSFKSQSDVIVIPVRLYQAELMMNKLEIGNSVKDLDLPLINIVSDHFDPSRDTDIDNHHQYQYLMDHWYMLLHYHRLKLYILRMLNFLQYHYLRQLQ